MCVNMALWLAKHAAWTAGKDEVREGEAKRVHTALRRAAGMFIFVQNIKGVGFLHQFFLLSREILRESSIILPKFLGTDKVTDLATIRGSDFDPSVLNAYINQCTAEAQEVTVARAIELKHRPALISALAHETSAVFLKAGNFCSFLPPYGFPWKIPGDWDAIVTLQAVSQSLVL